MMITIPAMRKQMRIRRLSKQAKRHLVPMPSKFQTEPLMKDPMQNLCKAVLLRRFVIGLHTKAMQRILKDLTMQGFVKNVWKPFLLIAISLDFVRA